MATDSGKSFGDVSPERYSIAVRSELPGEEIAIRQLHEQAFGRPFEGRIPGLVRNTPDFVPALSLVALEESKLVGHALCFEIAIQTDHRERSALALGPIGVRPDRQRQGIGSRLIETGLEIATGLEYGAVILIGHPTYYPRFGFVPASPFGLRTAYSVPDDVFMVRLLRPDGLDGIRGTVVFPPAFDE